MASPAEAAFLAYAGIGVMGRPVTLRDHLEASKFLKLMRDSKLIGKGLDAPKVDVIVMRVTHAGKRMSYPQFLEALAQVAESKGITQEVVTAKLAQANPTASTTKADFVKFHDDKSTYTGMYK